MLERSKRICFYDDKKLSLINEESLKLWQKYKMDMMYGLMEKIFIGLREVHHTELVVNMY